MQQAIELCDNLAKEVDEQTVIGFLCCLRSGSQFQINDYLQDDSKLVLVDERMHHLTDFASKLREVITTVKGNSLSFMDARTKVLNAIGHGYVSPRWQLVPESQRIAMKDFKPAEKAAVADQETSGIPNLDFNTAYLSFLSDVSAKVNQRTESHEKFKVVMDTLVAAAATGLKERAVLLTSKEEAEAAVVFLGTRNIEVEAKDRRDGKCQIICKWK